MRQNRIGGGRRKAKGNLAIVVPNEVDSDLSAKGPKSEKSRLVAAIPKSGFFPTVAGLQRWSPSKGAVMSRLAIAFVLTLAATAANAQDDKFEQSQTPLVAGTNGTRPFLFDGRMRGDGSRQRADDNDHHPIVVPPKASQPGRER